MTCRHLVIGLDGADLDVVARPRRGSAPEPHRARWGAARRPISRACSPPRRSRTGRPSSPASTRAYTASSTSPPATATRCASPPAPSARPPPSPHASTPWASPSAASPFPRPGPPSVFARGVFISGWDAPVAFEADRSFCWPPALHDAILRALRHPALRRRRRVRRRCARLARASAGGVGRARRKENGAVALAAPGPSLGPLHGLLRRERHRVALPREPSRRALPAGDPPACRRATPTGWRACTHRSTRPSANLDRGGGRGGRGDASSAITARARPPIACSTSTAPSPSSGC